MNVLVQNSLHAIVQRWMMELLNVTRMCRDGQVTRVR